MKKLLFILIIPIVIFSCSKDKPENPYDGVDYSVQTSTSSNPDPNSIIGLHKNIFFPKCSRSGCHDGTFEPDYRTVQSTYSTLVYQPVKKKVLIGSTDTFALRVIPFDTTKSFLHERVTTTTTDYMPSNGTRLSRDEINHINNWIMSGAKDEYGNVAVAPDAQPVFTSAFVTDSAYQDIDTIRVNGAGSPILFGQNKTVNFFFIMTDDHTAPGAMINSKIKFSTLADDFSAATSMNATWIGAFNLWMVSFKTTAFPINTKYYFRLYCNDGKHTADAEYPRNDLLFYYKEYATFIIK